MHVVIVNHRFTETDGQGRVNLRVATHLADRGHRVTLIGDDVPATLASRGNVTWLPTKPPRLPTTAARQLIFSRQVARRVRSLGGDYDALHVNGGQALVPAEVNACHFVHAPWLGSPFHPRRTRPGPVGVYQGLWTRINARRERLAYGRARRVVAVSDLVRDQLADDVGVDWGKIAVIPNASDPPPDIARDEARRRLLAAAGWGGDDDPFVVMFAGEVKGRRKNLDVAMRAIGRLPGRFRLTVAGATEGGPYPATAAGMGLGERVAFLGHRGDVRELYAGADAFAFCSHYDPCPIVIVEALAAGLPTATATSVGNHTMVAEAGGLVLDDPADDATLAQWLRALADDPARRADLSRRAAAVAAGRTWAAAGAAYEALYEEAASERGLGR